jgi:hypothetical protein
MPDITNPILQFIMQVETMALPETTLALLSYSDEQPLMKGESIQELSPVQTRDFITSSPKRSAAAKPKEDYEDIQGTNTRVGSYGGGFPLTKNLDIVD